VLLVQSISGRGVHHARSGSYSVTPTYLEPLRVQYYVHHPRGRAHAPLVGVTVPPFYASVTVADPEPAAVRARVKTRVYVAPVVKVRPQARAVWIGSPPPGWRAKVKVKVKPAPVRARVGWYVRPPNFKGSVLVGMPVKAKLAHGLKVAAPRPRADVGGGFKGRLGGKIRVEPPDLGAAAKARMKVKLGTGGIMVRPPAAQASVRAHTEAETKAKLDAAGRIKGDIHAPAVPDAKVRVKPDRLKAPTPPAGGVGAGADVKVKLKVPAPPPPPKVEVKGKIDAKAKLKIGG
jgi:hypothetical protein